MDYSTCIYSGRFVDSTSEYVNAFRNNYFCVVYNPKNREKMIEEIQRIINFNSSVDLYAYAHLLWDDNTTDSLSKAYNILDIISSWNYIPAKHLLAQMYFNGNYIEKDLSKFYSLTLEAVNANFIISKNSLALAYFNGWGCEVNYEKGHKLLEECIKYNYGLSYFNLGVGYAKGQFGYPKDEYKAFEYFKLGAKQYQKMACYNLGIMYLSGMGCVKNNQKALEQLILAASLGHIKAQVKVGDAYYFGEITKKDYETAYEFYLMAAEQKDPYAMYSVGYMIVNKQKLYVDKYVGLDWLRKAAYHGNKEASELLNKL